MGGEGAENEGGRVTPPSPHRAAPPTPPYRPPTAPLPPPQISRLLVYSPTLRATAREGMAHPFFDELRDPACRLPNGARARGDGGEG